MASVFRQCPLCQRWVAVDGGTDYAVTITRDEYGKPSIGLVVDGALADMVQVDSIESLRAKMAEITDRAIAAFFVG